MHDKSSQATLENTADHPRLLRVKIGHDTVLKDWEIQLHSKGLSVADSEQLSLTFKARAEKPRAVTVGVKMSHAPWGFLGFHQRFEVGTEWKDFSFPVAIKSGDSNAELCFDIGDDLATVEIDQVTLHRTASGEVLEL